jgi:hypothetical protein
MSEELRPSDRTISCRGEHVRKPQGYRQAVTEQCVCLLLLCLPYYQALLFAGMSGMISVLLMTCLLLFVVAGSLDIYHSVAGCLKALPLPWAAPILDRTDLWVALPSHAFVQEPGLAPSFQRPPPIFS